MAHAGRSRAARKRVPPFWRGLIEEMFGPYRPERHYMRGPGPKWRAKHGLVARGGCCG